MSMIITITNIFVTAYYSFYEVTTDEIFRSAVRGPCCKLHGNNSGTSLVIYEANFMLNNSIRSASKQWYKEMAKYNLSIMIDERQ